MPPRPGLTVDLPQRSFHRSPSPRHNLLSPQAGDVPPALSPLDAFALQGRILAQRLEESHQHDHRVSRLPANAIAKELARPRVNFYHNRLSPPASGPRNEQQVPPSTNSRTVQPNQRPKSYYPIIQTFDDASSILSEESDLDDEDTPMESMVDYFNIPQEAEPKASDEKPRGRTLSKPPPVQERPPPIPRAQQSRPQNIVVDSPRSPSARGLAPFRSPFLRSPNSQLSIRPVRRTSGDDSHAQPVEGNPFPQYPTTTNRKPSTGSGLSLPRSPFSPVFAPPRSPSMSSEYSVGLVIPDAKPMNFSRPISRSGRPSCDARPSTDTLNKSFLSGSPANRSFWEGHTPEEGPSHSPFSRVVTPSFDVPESSGSTQTKSFRSVAMLTKNLLPRGRNMEEYTVALPAYQRSDDVQPDDSDKSVKLKPSQQSLESKGLGLSNVADYPAHPVFPCSETHGLLRSRSADSSVSHKVVRGHRASPSVPVVSPRGSPIPGLTSSPLSHTSAMTPTLHPIPNAARTPLLRGIDQLTPEEHLDKGISSHDQGSFQKSTYHLRIAARAGLPTAMLLYALACRHGWGMRPNQAEGVVWLKKAVNSSGLEVAADDHPTTSGTCGPPTSSFAQNDSAVSVGANSTPLDRKAHQAQLALAIYELGVSYMNGWGIAQNKALALRCFEIAGSQWGDADALAEAGFCYAKGVGCKKDLKRAAELYRRAEGKGISMAGNSWIYKDKYMPSPGKDGKGIEPGEARGRSVKSREKEVAKEKEKEKEKEKRGDKEKKPTRDKSRTRNLFGGKKKVAPLTEG